MVHNDDVVAPGEGFDMHQHRDVELVTWVMEGRLRHRDDGGMEGSAAGAESILSPGMAQRVSAGRGIRHSELNASGYLDGKKLRVIQAWLPPDELGAAPSHDEADLNDALADGTLVPVASGTQAAADHRHHGATLRIGRLPAGRTSTCRCRGSPTSSSPPARCRSGTDALRRRRRPHHGPPIRSTSCSLPRPPSTMPGTGLDDGPRHRLTRHIRHLKAVAA